MNQSKLFSTAAAPLLSLGGPARSPCLAAADSDGLVSVWSLHGGDKLFERRFDGAPVEAFFDPAARRLVVATGASLHALRLPDFVEEALPALRAPGIGSSITLLDLDAADGIYFTDGSRIVYRTLPGRADAEPILHLRGDDDVLRCLGPDHARFIVATWQHGQGRSCLVDRTPDLLQRGLPPLAAWSPLALADVAADGRQLLRDGRTLVVRDSAGRELLRTRTDTELPETWIGIAPALDTIAVPWSAPDGGREGAIALIDVASGRRDTLIPVGDATVVSVVFAPASAPRVCYYATLEGEVWRVELDAGR